MTGSPERDRAIAELRARIAAAVKKHPDDSHGDGWTNHGLSIALGIFDRATDAPCRPRPRLGNSGPDDQWCELHGSHQDNGAIRCNGYQYAVKDIIPALAQPATDGITVGEEPPVILIYSTPDEIAAATPSQAVDAARTGEE